MASCLLIIFPRDQPGAECHPGLDSTVLDLCSLGQALVCPIVMQAEGGTFAVKAPYSTQPILGMMDNGPPLETKRARTAIGLAYPTFGGLQAMELTTMQHGWHDIPESPTGRFPLHH